MGLSNSDVHYLQRHTNELNLNDVNAVCPENILQPEQNNMVDSDLVESGTLQQHLPPNTLSESILNNSSQPNHFVQVSGETSSLGVVTLKTGAENSADSSGKKFELVSKNVSVTPTNCVTTATSVLPSQINLGSGVTAIGQVSDQQSLLKNVQLLQGSQNIPVQIGESGSELKMNVPVQVMTSATDSSVYVLAVTIEDPKEDGKTKQDVIYVPVTNSSETNDPVKEDVPVDSLFPQPQRTSTPKILEDELHPLNDTIIAGNVDFMQSNTHLTQMVDEVKRSGSTEEKRAEAKVRTSNQMVDDEVKHSGSTEEKGHFVHPGAEVRPPHVKKDTRTNLDFNGGQDKKKLIEVTKGKTDVNSAEVEETHNDSYCRKWVEHAALKTGKGDISTTTENAQSENITVHEDNTSLLDVTSVSRNVPDYKVRKIQPKKNVGKPVEQKTNM